MLMGSRLSLDNMVLFTECRETGNKSAIGAGNGGVGELQSFALTNFPTSLNIFF